MTEHLRKLSPGRIVVLGFAFVILTGSRDLWLPIWPMREWTYPT